MFKSPSDDDVTRTTSSASPALSWAVRLVGRPLVIAAGRLLGISILAVAAIVPVATDASAAPVDEQPYCAFTLTAPRTTQIPGGATAVTATFAAQTCSGAAQPAFVTVCVTTPDSPGQCVKNYGWSVAEIVVPTARISGAFIATGSGCFRTVETEVACTPSGPIATSLFG